MAHRRAATTTTSKPVTRYQRDHHGSGSRCWFSALTSGVVQSPILLDIENSCVTKRAPGCQTRQQHKERVCMADDKVTNQALIRPQPPIELRDLTLASFYPRTQSP